MVLLMVLMGCALHATELRYEQPLTITRFTNMEDLQDQVEAFCEAIKDFDTIQIKDILFYKQCYSYNAEIVCQVAEEDADLMRIQAQLPHGEDITIGYRG